jgi:endonuclease/exonuclease/phosphatase family metal-dependent hydrolase
MKSLVSCWSLFCLAMILTSAASGQEPALPSSLSNPLQLRVLCYNIHHGRGGDDQVDLERLAKVIHDCQPDLVALQEVDHRTRRTGGVDQTAELARLTGLHAQFARQIDFEGGQYGQAILSRWPLSDLQIHWLPGDPAREQRIVATCQVDLPGRQLLFGTTHLHHNNPDMRLRQAREITNALGSRAETVILAGDLNAEPEHAPIAELHKFWAIVDSASELKTFPAVEPSKQIDYILFRPVDTLRIVSSQVIEEPMASDHRPLLAVLEWTK